ncbi:MAG TPA: lipid-A-disaccharide synthase [Chthoniobacteraceae bacterium]|nr:lipid-A-disaccharide synthase [Chthoniobacteraceae bacterium]
MKLYLIAGEASGDARGAEVMRSLSHQAEADGVALSFRGAGGPKMKALAPAIDDWSGEAVVGLWDVLKKYGYFRRKFHAMQREIAEWQPDAVVFIDYPGFNLRLARALRRERDAKGGSPPPKLFYYISPQVWAWNRRRVPQMARTLDLMLCIFPFEKELYEATGLETVFVGHPMLDTLAAARRDLPRQSDLVALLPGSRGKEVSRIFPVMAAAAWQMHRKQPHLRFEVAAASDALAQEIRSLAAAAGFAGESAGALTVRTGGSHDLMQQAAVGMVASGTATVESAYFGLPFLLVYRVAPLTWSVGKALVKVPFLGMVNILAGEAIVPEFLQNDATPDAIARTATALLTDTERRDRQTARFREIIAGLGEGGAGARAAEAIFRRALAHAPAR